MNPFKSILVSGMLITTLVVCFAFPKPKYAGSRVFKNLNIPITMPNWRSQDFSKAIQQSKDDRFNFLSGAFARIYGNRQADSLLLLVLDAGNFHHPRLCYGGSGFKTKDLEDLTLQTPNDQLRAKTFLAKKNQEAFVVIYWMCINQKPVDWTEQKFAQLWHSLFNKKQAGLMVRLDIPVERGSSDESTRIQSARTLGQTFLNDLVLALSVEDRQWMFGKKD